MWRLWGGPEDPSEVPPYLLLLQDPPDDLQHRADRWRVRYEGLNGGMEGLTDSLTVCVVSADFDALYEELQQLGEGGFGSVFAGCRKEDRLPVAIKHIPMAKVSMTQETVEGRLTDFPLEVSLMLRAAEDRPDPGGPGAVVHSRNKSKKAKRESVGEPDAVYS
ncbi:unnamed protein product [Boreogadus saida]